MDGNMQWIGSRAHVGADEGGRWLEQRFSSIPLLRREVGGVLRYRLLAYSHTP